MRINRIICAALIFGLVVTANARPFKCRRFVVTNNLLYTVNLDSDSSNADLCHKQLPQQLLPGQKAIIKVKIGKTVMIGFRSIVQSHGTYKYSYVAEFFARRINSNFSIDPLSPTSGTSFVGNHRIFFCDSRQEKAYLSCQLLK